jgi:hypothetical protein
MHADWASNLRGYCALCSNISMEPLINLARDVLGKELPGICSLMVRDFEDVLRTRMTKCNPPSAT